VFRFRDSRSIENDELDVGTTRMKRYTKRILVALAVVTLPLLVWLGLGVIQLVKFEMHVSSQMKAGKLYMDSLSPEDIQTWTIRAETLLREHDPSDPIPEDLQALRIFRISVSRPDYISFDWMGGIDHTELAFRRTPKGDFRVTAVYNDNEEKQLWPTSGANKALHTSR
ncbi:hypothetical protein ACFLS1_13010, partial [Verrucomicrobiota bacterium]